ncbi:MAG TPA: SRPBCC domain-containing protein [Bryobacteraceae bacterium]|nr:SRPBCC domain-containing protein [Bryobacteraceae bacterium]
MKSQVKISGNRLQITRIFDAPRALVFSWWSQAEKMQQWSGCKDATRCEIEMDFRVGGTFKQTMQIAGAGAFTLTGKYEEIVVPEKIAYSADLGGHASTHVVVEFFEEGNGTRMVLTQEGLPGEVCNFVAQGTSESFEKLEAKVASEGVAGSLAATSERMG